MLSAVSVKLLIVCGRSTSYAAVKDTQRRRASREYRTHRQEKKRTEQGLKKRRLAVCAAGKEKAL